MGTHLRCPCWLVGWLAEKELFSGSIGLSVCSLTRPCSSGVLVWKYAVWNILVWKYVSVKYTVCAIDWWWSRWFDKSASRAPSSTAALMKRLALRGWMLQWYISICISWWKRIHIIPIIPCCGARFTQCLRVNQQTHLRLTCYFSDYFLIVLSWVDTFSLLRTPFTLHAYWQCPLLDINHTSNLLHVMYDKTYPSETIPYLHWHASPWRRCNHGDHVKHLYIWV